MNADGDAMVAADSGPVVSGPGRSELLTVDGQPVTVYLPAFTDPTYAAPVVFSMHGLSIPSAQMADITGLPALADEKGFVAVFPEGVAGSWNTGGSSCGLGAFAGNTNDDYTYLQHILTAVEKLQPIDRERIFASGFSMGGYATNALACKHPEMFRAVAPASGGAPPGPCTGAAVPVMIFHGTSDGTIAHDCGVQAAKLWATHNGCSTEVDTVTVQGGTCQWHKGCPENGQVVFCSYPGMAHGWAGSTHPLALGGTQYESATALMWSFFEERL
jgi:polyhydroxybutyrate depolymerase